MKDHPDIHSYEQTGYDRESWQVISHQKNIPVHKLNDCPGCGEPVYSDEERVDTPDGFVHDDHACMKKYILRLTAGEFNW